MNRHICSCNECLGVIVGVVQEVLAEEFDDESSHGDTEDTVILTDEDSEQEDLLGGIPCLLSASNFVTPTSTPPQ